MTVDRPVLASLVLDTFDDLERSIEDLGGTEAETRLQRFSSISWTVAHVGQTIDAWLVSRLANQPRDDYLAREEFRKGSPGEGVEWDSVRSALSKVLDKARAFLRTVDEDELEEDVLYQGSLEPLKGKFVARYYWLARVVAHTYYHIGEITTIRSAGGDKVIDFPGALIETHEGKRYK